jgi:type IV pilus assembly protein PilA
MRKVRGFSLIELMIIVAILGIIAALAIPAYVKYLRRSRTIEATMNLRKIFDASVAYYNGLPKTDANGNSLPTSFPASTGPSPGANLCCGQPGDKCKASPTNFDDNTWSALNFSVDDPFNYWYQYVAVGTGSNSTFQAFAYGNLDCDNIYGTYMRGGHVQADQTVTGSGGIFSKNDIE